MACGKDMYLDPGTHSCAYCSELCFSVDIQGTREECIKRCPGYLETQEIEINSPLPLHRGTTEATDLSAMDPSQVAIIIISCLAVLCFVGFIMFLKRKSIIKRIKRQDCCSDGISSQPHAQETGAGSSQPQDSLLVDQGYPDLPNSMNYSFNSQVTRV